MCAAGCHWATTGLGQDMGSGEGGTPCFCLVGLQTALTERGDAVGGTAWATEGAGTQGLPSWPAAAEWDFWAWPGTAVCTKEALGGAHRTVF